MQVVTFGGRSISILEILPDGTLAMVYDSGQELEARHHTHWPQLHNMDFPDGFCAPNDDIARQLAGALILRCSTRRSSSNPWGRLLANRM